MPLKLAIIGPPAKRHLNGVSLAGRLWPDTECLLVSLLVLQEIRTNDAKKPSIIVIFQGGGGLDPLPPSGSAHVSCVFQLIVVVS